MRSWTASPPWPQAAELTHSRARGLNLTPGRGPETRLVVADLPVTTASEHITPA